MPILTMTCELLIILHFFFFFFSSLTKSGYSVPKCNGYPRNKVNQGDWISESTNYLWDLSSAQATNEQGGRHACHPQQRSPTYPSQAPETNAKAGETLRVRFWGNGHTSYEWGRPIHVDPGLVRIYCSNSPNEEIVMVTDLTPDKLVAEGNFSADAISMPKAGNQPNDKANWMFLNIPKSYSPGRRMCVWTWASIKNEFEGGWENRYTTCFDMNISGSEDPTYDHSQWTPGTQSQSQPVDNKSQVQEKCAATCFKGGMSQYPCTNSDCPPCRYGTNCFGYDSSGKCPAWAGGFDCTKGQPI